MASVRSQLEKAGRFLVAENFPRAEKIAREVLAAAPDNHTAMRILAIALRGQERLDEAISLLRAALALRPNDPHTLADLGGALAKRRDHREAYLYLQMAANINPNLPGVMLNLGAVLAEEGHQEDALRATSKALQLEPTNAFAHYNMGNSLRELNRQEEAIQHYELAVRYRPDYDRAKYNLGVCRLLVGQYREAWPLYDLRYCVGEVALDDYPQPRWDGSPLTGKSLLIHGEQGVGDEVLFASCVPDVASQAKRVALVCDPRLGPLFARSFPQVAVRPFNRLNTREPAPLTETFDFQIPAGSLPRYLRPDLASFPRRDRFLFAAPEQVSRWRERFAALGPGLKIGLSWRAGGKAIERLKRCIPLADWYPILATPGVHFINVQYGDATQEIAAVRERFGISVHDWEEADPLIDMDGFAAKISALDLVISVVNTTVDLAGSLGTPAWTLLPLVPSWRWLSAGETIPWYSSVKLFRRATADGWRPVIDRIADELHERVGARRTTPNLVEPAPDEATSAGTGLAAKSGYAPAIGRLSQGPPDPNEPTHWLKQSDLLGHDVLDFLKTRLSETERLYDAKRYAEAEDLLREVLQIAPRHALAHKLLGMVAWKTGRLDLAVQSFRRALSGVDGDPKLHYSMAATLALSGRYEEAIVHYRRSFVLAPSHRATHLELGLALQRVGRHAEAIGPFQVAQALNPKDFDAYLHHGRSLMELARWDAARRMFVKAAELEPCCGATWFELGRNLALDDEFQLAESCLRRASAIEPRNTAYVDRLARVLEATGRHAHSIELYENALAADPQDPDSLAHLAEARRRRGQLEAGRELLERAVAIRPHDARLQHVLATTLAEQGRFAAAIGPFDRAITLDPRRESARRERSRVFMALGQLRDAWPQYEATSAAPPGLPPEAGDVPLWTGEWLNGKTILIRAERGLAEQFLYATAFGEIIAEAGHCLIECDERIAGLFTRAFPQATISPLDPFELALGKQPARSVDFQTSAVGLMKLLRADRARFLRRPPRFVAAPDLYGRMQRRLATLPPGIRIGVARGEGLDEPAARQSAAMWRRLLAAAPHVQFVDLRLPAPDVWPTGLRRSTCCGCPPAADELAIGNLHDCGRFARVGKWEELAALIAALDLVIAEDGPIWPLAGLLGVGAWALCPRAPLGPQWLADAQGRSLWMPSVRIFHPQRLGDVGDLAKQAVENISSRYFGAVDLSTMGKPVGPHWLTSPAVRAMS